MITNLFQPPRDDLLQHPHDAFQSCPRGFDTYPFEHLDLLYEENFQPPLCSNFDEGEDMICQEQDFCDEILHPSSFPSFHYAIEDTVGKHVPHPKLSPMQNFFLEFKGRLDALRRNLTPQSFIPPLSNYMSPSRVLFIPSQLRGVIRAKVVDLLTL
jgi:hypothetical protein